MDEFHKHIRQKRHTQKNIYGMISFTKRWGTGKTDASVKNQKVAPSG